jgi:hypothetical protein
MAAIVKFCFRNIILQAPRSGGVVFPCLERLGRWVSRLKLPHHDHSETCVSGIMSGATQAGLTGGMCMQATDRGQDLTSVSPRRSDSHVEESEGGHGRPGCSPVGS